MLYISSPFDLLHTDVQHHPGYCGNYQVLISNISHSLTHVTKTIQLVSEKIRSEYSSFKKKNKLIRTLQWYSTDHDQRSTLVPWSPLHFGWQFLMIVSHTAAKLALRTVAGRHQYNVSEFENTAEEYSVFQYFPRKVRFQDG